MAPNFKISMHRYSNNLHVKLSGDFDGSSAWELFNILEKNAQRVARIIIHCNHLREVEPFGKAVFENRVRSLRRNHAPLLFTGKKASQVVPESHGVLRQPPFR